MSIPGPAYHSIGRGLLSCRVVRLIPPACRNPPRLARHFSEHAEAAPRTEEQAEPPMRVGSSSKPIREGGQFGKFHQEVSLSQPDLAALDELDPSNQRKRRPRQHNFQQGARRDAWRKTLEKVMRSFTSTQLQRLCVEAEVPLEVFAHYGAGGRVRARKDISAKALLTHRFRMKDPELLAKTEQLREKRAGQSKQSEVPISQIALLMVVLRGQREIQTLLQVHRVKMKPKRRGSEDDLALLLQGSQDGIDLVEAWIESFVERIQSVSRPLSFFSVSDNLHPPDDHRLRLISQLSRTIVSLDETAENVTIHSVDEESVASAETMIAQFIFDAQQSQRRQYYTYASPALMGENQASVATYAFVPHVGPSPLSWLSDPGSHASLFRLARQDIQAAQNKIFSQDEKEDKAVLRHFNMPDSYDDIMTELIGKDPFLQLREQLEDQDRPSCAWSFNAEFGHLLFDNHNHQSVSSRVLSLVKPPVQGTWPLEYGLDWLRKLTRREVESSSTPTFCASLPPLAVSLDAGYVPLAPMSSGMSFSNSAGGERTRQNNDQWSIELMRMGFPLGLSRTKNDLTDLVDLKKFHFTETTVVTYAGRDSDLVIELEETDGENVWEDRPHRVKVHRAEWMKKAASDVMVPESSMDVRLGATRSEVVSKEDLMHDEGLQRYLEDQEHEGIIDDGMEARAMVLPRRATVQGKEALFISAKKTSRWEWNMLTEPAIDYQGKFILERTAPSDEGGYTSTFKIQFAQRIDQRQGEDRSSVEQGEAAFQEKEAALQAAFGERPPVAAEVKDGGIVEDIEDTLEQKEGATALECSDEERKAVEEQEGSEAEETAGDQSLDEKNASNDGHLSPTPQWHLMRPYVDRFLARNYRSIRS